MKIAVILPSRGLIYADVMEGLLENLYGLDFKIYFATALGIPDNENIPLEKALEDGFDYVWFIEDDTVPPEGALDKLVEAMQVADIAAVDYGVNGWGCAARSKIDNSVLWTGLGCTLVKRSVFDKLEKPYFRDDMQLRLNDLKWVPAPADRYGGQDIWFCSKAREAGCKIVQVEGECRHLKLDALGRPETNHGGHLISEKPKITKIQYLEI